MPGATASSTPRQVPVATPASRSAAEHSAATLSAYEQVGRLLGHETDVRDQVAAGAGPRDRRHRRGRCPRLGTTSPTSGAQQRRLAGAVAPHQRDDLPGRDRQRHVAHRGHGPVAHAHVGQDQRRRATRPRTTGPRVVCNGRGPEPGQQLPQGCRGRAGRRAPTAAAVTSRPAGRARTTGGATGESAIICAGRADARRGHRGRAARRRGRRTARPARAGARPSAR